MYTWGQGNGGKLGHGDETTYILPTAVQLFVNSRKRIVQVSAGRDHTLAVCSHGDLYAWGCDRYGQLGLGLHGVDTVKSGNDAEKVGGKVVATPRRVKLSAHVSDVSASSSHSLCVTDEGQVYSWGLNDRGQLGFRSTSTSSSDRAKRSSPNCVDVLYHRSLGAAFKCAAADGVSCLVTASGKVWQWGRGSPTPSRVLMKKRSTAVEDNGWCKAREGVRIISIATGPHHSCAISADGDLYTWGTSAELLGHSYKGRDRTEAAHTTVGIRVEELRAKKCRVVSASCSKRHTCAVDDCGQLWVWGYGDHGILGIGETYQPSPRRVPSLRRISHCCAADSHTIALVTAFKPQKKPTTPRKSPEQGEELFFEVEVEEEEDRLSDDSYSGPAYSPRKSRGQATVFEPRTLAETAENCIASFVNVWNVIHIWNFARTIHQASLEEYCYQFVLSNMDGVLVANKGCDAVLAEFFDCTQLSLMEPPMVKRLNPELLNLVKAKTEEKENSKNGLPPNKQKKDLTIPEAKKRLKSLKQKLRRIEDNELKLSAVKLKQQGKKRSENESAVLEAEIKRLHDFLGIPEKEEETLQDLFCKVCNVRVPDRLTMVDHVSGKRHRKLIARQQQKKTTPEPAQAQPKSIPIPDSNPKNRQAVTENLREEYGSSLDSMCSWGSPIALAAPKQHQDLREIMLAEEQENTRRRSLVTPVKSYRPEERRPVPTTPVAITTPVSRYGSSPASQGSMFSTTSPISAQSFNLSSFVKREPRSASAWSTDSRGSKKPSSVNLERIQFEQEAEVSRSLTTSSWGFCQKSVTSVAEIQREQDEERQSEILVRKLAEEEKRLKQKAKQAAKQKKRQKAARKKAKQAQKQTSPLKFRKQKVGQHSRRESTSALRTGSNS